MTDKYGMDHDEHEGDEDHAHAPDHERDHAPDRAQDSTSAEADVWSDQPPVDDFGDGDQGGEEMATVSEETEDPDHDRDDVATPESGKKNMAVILPIAAGVGGLLLLGAVLYWQFGDSSSSTPPRLPVAQAMRPESIQPPAPMSAAIQKPAPISAADANVDSSKSVADNGAALKTGMSPVVDASTSPAPPIPSVPMGTPPGMVGTSEVAPPPSLPAPPAAGAPPTAAAIASGAILSAPNVIPPAAPASPASLVMPNKPPAAAPPVNTIDTLTNRIDDLQKSLNKTSQQLLQVTNMVAANATPTPASPLSVSNSALEDRLAKLEQQLTQIQHATPVLAPPPVVAGSRSSVSISSRSKSTKRMASREAHKAHHNRHVKHTMVRHKKTKIVVQKPSRSIHDVAMEMSQTSHWVLRGATPNEAWVSTDESSKDLRHIQIGDELPGIGRVRAIHQNGDDWTVEGSQGNIR